MQYKFVSCWTRQVAFVATILFVMMTGAMALAQSTSSKTKSTDVPLPARVTKTATGSTASAAETGKAAVRQPLVEPDPVTVDEPKPKEQAKSASSKTDVRFTKTDNAVAIDSAKADVAPTDDAQGEAAPADVASEEKAAKATGDDLVPVADPEELGIASIEAASFKGVTPGVTTMAEVEKDWGPPKELNKKNDLVMHLYSIERFDRVEVSYAENKVVSVVIRFPKPFAADVIAQQLELTNVRPVLISNEKGEILGQSYPERGVLFAFEPNAEAPSKPSMKVAHIILEPIAAESFVLRAETNLDGNTRLSLLDLEEALKLQPDNARAMWLYSRALMAADDNEKAQAASAKAVKLEPDNPKYLITRAQILGQAGKVPEAIQEARKAVDISKERPHVLARAQCLLGDLTASGPKPDYKQAIRFHMDAVKTADPLTSDPHPAIRMAAKEVLIDAHLGAANDIAWGEWKDKEPAVTKWLSRAVTLSDEYVKTESGNQEQRFHVYTRALSTCVGLRNSVDPNEWTKQAVSIGDELIASSRDPLHKAQLQSDLGLALYDALQIYQMRSDHDSAMKYGKMAVAYLEQCEKTKPLPSSSYLLGRLYFRLGAIAAIRDKNHKEAVVWFDKAIPMLDKPLPSDAAADVGRHGESFVSMGVSYWEAGQREKAVKMTQKGVAFMEKAVSQNVLAESTLAIPYGNLSTMHRQLGADEDASRYQKMAAKVRNSKVQ
jgi:tetratricopeptide (TPR) repeat protein